MAGLLGKILSGVLVAGSSVLSVIAPPVGIPLLGLSVGVAGQAFSSHASDPVAQSGQALANNQVGLINTAAANMAVTTAQGLQQQALYQQYVNQGYSSSQAATMSGMSGTTTLPAWLMYAGIGVVALIVLKKLRIFK